MPWDWEKLQKQRQRRSPTAICLHLPEILNRVFEEKTLSYLVKGARIADLEADRITPKKE